MTVKNLFFSTCPTTVIQILCICFMLFSISTAQDYFNQSANTNSTSSENLLFPHIPYIRTVRVGLYENKPKIFTNSSGKPAGIFFEIFNEIGKKEGWSIEYVPCVWPEGLDAVKNGIIDIMPDVAYSAERDKLLDFHIEPVMESWSRVYSFEKIQKLADLNGKKIALLENSIQESILRQIMTGFGYKAIFVPVKTYEEAFQKTSAGQTDAAVSNYLFGDYCCYEYGLSKSPVVFNSAILFFATAQGKNADILSRIDYHLKELKNKPGSVYYKAFENWTERPPKTIIPRYMYWIITVTGLFLVITLIIIVILKHQIRKKTQDLLHSNLNLEQAQKNLSKRNRDLEHVLFTIPDALIYADTKRHIIQVNPGFSRIFGYTQEEIIGKETSELYYDYADFKAQGEIRFNINASSSLSPYELMYKRKNGETFIGETVGSPIRTKTGETVGMFGMIRDITDKKKLHAQFLHAQKMESIGRLAGGIAHDFNNILGIIVGQTELLKESEKISKNFQNSLEEIIHTCFRARNLTKQLLAFSKKQVFELLPIDVNTIVKNFDSLLLRIIGKHIVINISLDATPCMIMGDSGQIEQVFMNLAVNARDAMPEGGHFFVQTKNTVLESEITHESDTVAPGKYVIVTITDTGCGMNGETLRHIFEPFFTTKSASQGTGLGLATCYGIIKQHNGYIHVVSKPDKGTCFTLYFPCISENSKRI